VELIGDTMLSIWWNVSSFLSRPDTEKKLLISLVVTSLVMNILSMLARRREEVSNRNSISTKELEEEKNKGSRRTLQLQEEDISSAAVIIPANNTSITTKEEEKSSSSVSTETNNGAITTDQRTQSEIKRYDCETAARQRRLCVPLARWTNAVEINGPTFFISAQFGADDFGVLLPTAEQQCIAAFKNLQRALTDGGRTALDVAKLTVYMVHGRCGISQYRAAEGRFFPRDALPAVTIIFVPSLATENILVQIEAVAA